MDNPLTPPDPAALATFDLKMHLVRDMVTGVVRGYKTGLFLYGTGGVGKSYTVLRHLQAKDAPYHLFNSRMTAKGLFYALQEAPDAVHVLEDMERLTKDPDAQGVLRSALWSQPGHDRAVTWRTATGGAEKFAFRGGLILISNRPLADLPELRAMATRIEVHRLEVSDAELTALMWHLAAQGYRGPGGVGLSAEECGRVTAHLLKECRAAGAPLDLRLQQKAFQSYLQHAADCSVTHWEDLVAAGVREATVHFRHQPNTASPEARKADRRNALRRLRVTTPDDRGLLEAYRAETGASRSDYFRRKQEVEGGEFDAADAA